VDDILQLRTVIIGLLGFAAVEEELLLARAGLAAGEAGSPSCWAAVPLVAHNTEFKRQQVQRLDAIRGGQAPPEFTEIDHASDEVYRSYSQGRHAEVTRDSREVTAALIDGLSAISDDDLLDPSRHPWLKGRQLALQLIVRGFWIRQDISGSTTSATISRSGPPRCRPRPCPWLATSAHPTRLAGWPTSTWPAHRLSLSSPTTPSAPFGRRSN